MSEIQNNQGPMPAENHPYGNEVHNECPEGIAFKGEKTDLRYEPGGAIKRTWVEKPFKMNIDGHNVEIGQKQIDKVKGDLAFMAKNQKSVEKASSMFPAFHGYAARQGKGNPDSLALALEHYAATNEFVANAELEDN